MDSSHIIEYSYSGEDELGPHSYDEPFNLADLEQFPRVSKMNYKAALQRSPEELAANSVKGSPNDEVHKSKKKRSRSFKFNRIASGFKEFGHEIREVTKALVARIKSFDDSKEQPRPEPLKEKAKSKSKSESTKSKGKEKEKLAKEKSKDKHHHHEKKPSTKEKKHKSKGKGKGKGKGKEEQKPSPRSDQENVEEVSVPYNVERALDSVKDDVNA